jgi:hypothetical protein
MIFFTLLVLSHTLFCIVHCQDIYLKTTCHPLKSLDPYVESYSIQCKDSSRLTLSYSFKTKTAFGARFTESIIDQLPHNEALAHFKNVKRLFLAENHSSALFNDYDDGYTIQDFHTSAKANVEGYFFENQIGKIWAWRDYENLCSQGYATTTTGEHLSLSPDQVTELFVFMRLIYATKIQQFTD